MAHTMMNSEWMSNDPDAYVPCPECKGSRLVMAIGPWNTGGYVHCQLCKGEGELTMADLSNSPEQWIVDTYEG